jgi:hypothetical protein
MSGPLRKGRPRLLLLPELILLGVGVLLLVGWGATAITDSSLFCGSTCHLMLPYRDVWRTSRHADVACVVCHDEVGGGLFARRAPGLYRVYGYVTGSSAGMKRIPQFSDSVCLARGCHDSRLLAGGVAVKWSRVPFDHRPHLQSSRRGLLLRCTSCHSKEVMGMSQAADRDPCFLCHRPQPGGQGDRDCVFCHSAASLSPGPDSLHRRSAAGEGPSCRKCHSRMGLWKGEADRSGCPGCHTQGLNLAVKVETEELHRRHVTLRQVKCIRCHPRTTHHPDPPPSI